MPFSSRPLPHLPLETQAAILRFCDVSTLAVSSRVCLAWLELAGPVLYEHITIRGKQQLDLMIRSESVLAGIAPFVSLEQTKAFTYVLPANVVVDQADIEQRISSSTVPIDTLIIDGRQTVPNPKGFQVLKVNVLLRSFSPKRLQLLALPGSHTRIALTFKCPFEVAWSDLREVTFAHSLFQGDGRSPTLPMLAERYPALNVVYDISNSKWPSVEGDLRDCLDDIQWELSSQHGDPDGPLAVGHVRVWMADEDEVALAKEILVDYSCASLDIGVKKHADA